MKHGGEYAKRVKRLFNQLVRKHGKPAAVEPTDPLEQLIVGILAICSTSNKAEAVFHKLNQEMVDLNELRVTPPMELAALIETGVPLAREKAQRIVDSLNDVRRRQDTLDLGFLRQRTRREAREYLESLEGVDPSAAARVVLYSLGGHAIPVDNLALYILRKEELVDPDADIPAVQGFLERHVSAADAQAFVELLSRHIAVRSTRIDMDTLPELLSPPPPEPAPEPEPEPVPEPEPEPEPKPAPAPKKASSKKAAAPAKSKKSKASRASSKKPAAKSAKKKATTRATTGKTKKTVKKSPRLKK